MSIKKTCYSLIASLTVVVMALLAAIMILGTLPLKSLTRAAEAPTVYGRWTDGISGVDNPRFKSYNASNTGTTPANAIVIMTATDLAFLSWTCASGIGSATENYYRLGDDIDLEGKAWVPIGGYSLTGTHQGTNVNYSFQGALDGTKYDALGNEIGRYKIKNATILEYGGHYMGLVGVSVGISEFTNIDMEDVYMQQASSYYRAGALVGHVNLTLAFTGTIKPVKSLRVENVTVSGYLGSSYVSTSHIGGIVGRADLENYNAVFENCVNNIEIQTSAGIVGGIVGGVLTYDPNSTWSGTAWVANTTVPTQTHKDVIYSQVVFRDCVNNAEINALNGVGGIAGWTYSANFYGCINNGDILASESNSSGYSGGIVGRGLYNANLEDCHNYADIFGYNVGGLVGYITDAQYNGYINNSHNEGAISAGQLAGGLMGDQNSLTTNTLFKNQTCPTLTITSSYNTGSLATNVSAGGLICYNYGKLVVDECYNTASVENSTQGHTGGIVALNRRGGVEISNSYNTGSFDVQQNVSAGGLIGGQGLGDTSAAYTALTDQEVKIINSYNLGDISAKTHVGGLAGQVHANLIISGSYNAGAVQGGATNAGGLVGNQRVSGVFDNTDSIISQSYNVGELYSNSVTNVGGLIGLVDIYVQVLPAGLTPKPITFSIVESYNAVTVIAATATGGLVGKYEFTAQVNATTLAVNYSLAFALQNEERNLSLHHSTSAAASGIVSYDIDKYLVDGVLENLSRVILLEQFRDKNTFFNIPTLEGGIIGGDAMTVGYDFDAVWSMPTSRNSTANKGFPYLYDLAGFTISLVIDGVTETYEATINEEFSRRELQDGKTFGGWSTLPNGAGTLYVAGEIINLMPSVTVLYAVFTYTEYYDIIFQDLALGGALEAYYSTTDAYYGYSLQADSNGTYMLQLVNPSASNFVGWQVWKQTGANTGEWHNLTTNIVKNFNFLIRVDQTFIDTYAIAYDTVQGTEFKVVGYFMFRAAKQYDSVKFSAIMDMSAGSNPSLVGAGQLTFDNRPARLDGSEITSFPEGTTVALRVTPNTFYGLVSMKIYETDAGYVESVRTINIAIEMSDNLLNYVVPVGYKSFKVEVRFEKIAYSPVLNVETRDGDTNLNALNLVVPVHVDTLLLNDSSHVEYTAQDTLELGSVTYELVGYRMRNLLTNEYDFIAPGNLGGFLINSIITSDFLASYASGTTVNITAIYAETYLINITVPTGGTFDIRVIDLDTSESKPYNSASPYYEKGTNIIIVANPSANYEFAEFTGHSGGIIGDTIDMIVSQNCDISAIFNYKVYELVIIAENMLTKIVITSSYQVGLQIAESEVEGNVRIGSKITATSLAPPANFRFVGFYLRNNSGDIELTASHLVDSALLANYLTLGNKINIIAKYIEQRNITLMIDDNQVEMGGYEVRKLVGGSYIVTSDRTFDKDTRIEIVAIERTHFKFVRFENISGYEAYGDDAARIMLSSNKTVWLVFAAIEYQFVGDAKVNGATAGGSLYVSKTSFNVGQQVVIMYTPASGQSVKSWKINGKDISKLAEEFGSDFVRSGDSVTITITPEWYAMYQTRLENEITTGLDSSILYVIIGVGIAVPALLAILIIFFVLNAKKKKLIKVELKEQQAANYKMDTGSFIKDLRSGKSVGQVTDEDVKAEMKRRKKAGKR